MPKSNVVVEKLEDQAYDLSTIKLTKDLKQAAKLLPLDHVRYLVDIYYQLQQDRMRAKSQTREEGQPYLLLDFVSNHAAKLERTMKSVMQIWCQQHEATRWMMSIRGIGPILAAGIRSHINIHKAPTAGHIWNFAGLNPEVQWEKGTKRPWNAQLKVLCWKAGQSFLKFHKHPLCHYGHIYAQRKIIELGRNKEGLYAEQAALKLKKFKIGKDTDAYKAYSNGKLPPAHLDQRAQRVAVKLFLAHLHHVLYEIEFKTVPPSPYSIAIQGHAHYIAPYHWDSLKKEAV